MNTAASPPPLPTLQVRFCQAEPTGMIKDMEGVNVVLPLPPGADPVAQLERATQVGWLVVVVVVVGGQPV